MRIAADAIRMRSAASILNTNADVIVVDRSQQSRQTRTANENASGSSLASSVAPGTDAPFEGISSDTCGDAMS